MMKPTLRIRIAALAAALWLVPSLAFGAACSLTTISAGPPKVLACTDTTATTITVPADWNSFNNKVEAVAAGQNGQSSVYPTVVGNGGIGGGYAVKTNLSLTPGASASIQIGTANSYASPTTAADTWVVNTSTLLAVGGGSGSAAAGTTTYSGGGGGTAGGTNEGAGGGGGAAGKSGVGAAGAAGGSFAGGSRGGAGGTADNGTVNGGNGATASTAAQNGTAGTEWSASYGSGGGGGGGAGNTTTSCAANGGGGNGANYGGAGGGAAPVLGGNCTGGSAMQGGLILTYTPGAAFIMTPAVIP